MDTTSLAGIKATLNSIQIRDIIERDLGGVKFALEKDGTFTVRLPGFMNLGLFPHDFTANGKTRAEAVDRLFWQLICTHHRYPMELIAQPKSIRNIPVYPHPSTLPDVRKISTSSSLRDLWEDKDGRILSDHIKIPDLTAMKTFTFDPAALAFTEVDFENNFDQALRDIARDPEKKARLEMVYGLSGIAGFYARLRDKVSAALTAAAGPQP